MAKRIMNPRIINSEQQHREALAEVERLAAEDPAMRSPEGDRLELLAKLVEDYEKQKFSFAPGPAERDSFSHGRAGAASERLGTDSRWQESCVGSTLRQTRTHARYGSFAE